MEIGLLALHLAVGALFVGHGAQKLFGAFGGHGLEGTAGFFDSIGLRPGRLHATLAGGAEMVGGTLLALGLLTPLGAALATAVMVAAIATLHAQKGLWNSDGGYEFNLVMIFAAFALAAAGPGQLSLDAALGLDLAGIGWGLGALGAGILGGLGAVIQGRLAGRGEAGQPGASTA
jgi:putative oxidoreductase